MPKRKIPSQNQPKNDFPWLKLSIFFGLLPLVLDTLKDWADPILGIIPISDAASVVLVLSLSVTVPAIGIVKVQGWWRLIPIILVALNLILSFLAYALYQWANAPY